MQIYNHRSFQIKEGQNNEIVVNGNTVVSEKNGTFICQLILERYMYLSNIQKQLKITSYGRNIK